MLNECLTHEDTKAQGGSGTCPAPQSAAVTLAHQDEWDVGGRRRAGRGMVDKGSEAETSRLEQRVVSENPVKLKSALRPGRQAEEQAATGQAEGKGRSGLFGARGRRPGQDRKGDEQSGARTAGRRAEPDGAGLLSGDACAGCRLPTLNERALTPCWLPERTWPLPDAELLGVASGLGSGRRNGKGPRLAVEAPPRVPAGQASSYCGCFQPAGRTPPGDFR